MQRESLFNGVERARRGFWGRLSDFVARRRPVDDEIWELLEESLVESDMGVDLVLDLLGELRRWLPKRADQSLLWEALASRLESLLGDPVPLAPPGVPGEPVVYAVVGVNGSGKTTTIGKLAHRFKSEGLKVMLAAGDTFRAGAEEQLSIWARRSGASIVSHQPGADPAAVAFDAIQSALARGHEAVILDTAGRLHTRRNLMEELRKVLRVVAKALPGAPHETLLVLDATTGGNAIEQARQFGAACSVSGIVLTKLDGSARGGTVFRIRSELGIPIKLVGVGEGMGDLLDFRPADFVRALLRPALPSEGETR